MAKYVRLLSFFLLCIFTMCECSGETVMDITTPRNASLSGFYKRSFAYYTIKERLPLILTQTIDILVRNKEEIAKKYGFGAKEELKEVIGEISKLKYEIQTNKPMRNITSNASDASLYNQYLAKQTNVTYFTTVWLFAECYMYRRIREAFELTKYLHSHDPFAIQKQEAFNSSYGAMTELGKYLVSTFEEDAKTKNIKEEFIKLLKLNLWGNKCDLSFSAGIITDSCNPLILLSQLQSNIVSDHSEEVWLAASDLESSSQIIDIVLDNSGYELFADLCLADFLIANKMAQKIRIYVKNIPWFVSDVTIPDFDWTLKELNKSEDANLKLLAARWYKYVACGAWDIVENEFFTLPIDYSFVAKDRRDLYKKFAEAKLIIFKGDLNYRKLFGEKNWDPTTSIIEGLNGFLPTKLATLRTIKCQLVCGLDKGVAEKVEKEASDWQGSGNYGLIQYCGEVKPLI